MQSSVIQNHCRMQGRCVLEGFTVQHAYPMGEKAESSVQTFAKSDIENFFDLGFATIVKS